jgi:hypothetical protein
MEKNRDPGSGMKIPYHISENLETIFGLKVIKFFDADPDSESNIDIQDPQHCLSMYLAQSVQLRTLLASSHTSSIFLQSSFFQKS